MTVTTNGTIITKEEAIAKSTEYFNGDDLAAKVFVDKYALKDNDQNLLEATPDDMHHRIAKEFARIEKKKFKKPITKEEIFEYLDHFKRIIPQGSPMYGIGNDFQTITLSNCYAIESPLDSYGGIHKTDQQLTQICKRRGGVGLDISKIRPNGSQTHNAARSSTGIIPFMERFSNSIKEVAQNGRRGALMVTISCHHPDIQAFANIKRDLTKITGANLSIRLSDEFLEAVDKNKKYELRWPVDSREKGGEPKVSRMIEARVVWNQIIEAAHNSGEPGLLFWNNIIRESPADCYEDFKTETTNPCITSDTWILTSKGPQQVSELIDNSFKAVVNGSIYKSDKRGFYKTGTKPILEIETNRGYKIKCTDNHLIKIVKFKNRQKITSWKPAGEIKIDDIVSLHNHRNFEWDGVGNFEEGWLLGELLGDGVFTENTAKLSFWGETKEQMHAIASKYIHKSLNARSDCGEASLQSKCAVAVDRLNIKSVELSKLAKKLGVHSNKDLDDTIEKTSYDFHKGFLQGWFDADGTVLYNEQKENHAIRLGSVKLENLNRAQRMLSRLGIASTIYPNRKESGKRLLPDGCGSYAEYDCQANHELHIGKDNMRYFAEHIGFGDPLKQKKLMDTLSRYRKGQYAEKFTAAVKTINPAGCECVYDCTIPDVSEFDANGISVHNCSEIPLSPLDSCRLLLLNLLTYVDNAWTDKSKFNFDLFTEDAKIAQRLMDDLIDLEIEKIDSIMNKIKKDPEPKEIKQEELDMWIKIKKSCINGRRTGCGLTAIGDTLAALNIPYSSNEAVKIIDKIYKTFKISCYRSSVDMAKELGAFSVYDSEKEKDCDFIQRLSQEDPDLYKDMIKYGRRNIALLTSAPAGTVSLMTQTTSGIEPLFKPFYTRRKKVNIEDDNVKIDFTDQDGNSWEEFTVFHPQLVKWAKATGQEGNLNEELISKSPWIGNCAEDLDWKLRVKIQATANKHICHAISSTVNLPSDVSVEEVEKIYFNAWKSGCKGITVYRKDCRCGVLVEKETGAKRTESGIIKTQAPKRPKKLPVEVHHPTVNGEQYFVLVGMLHGEPYEVFAGKNGFFPRNIKRAIIKRIKRGNYECILDNGDTIDNIAEWNSPEEEALTRMTSCSLRHGADISFIVHQLEKTKGDMMCFAKAMSRCLKKHIPDKVTVTGEECESCGAELVRQDGCKVCKSCGWSACS